MSFSRLLSSLVLALGTLHAYGFDNSANNNVRSFPSKQRGMFVDMSYPGRWLRKLLDFSIRDIYFLT